MLLSLYGSQTFVCVCIRAYFSMSIHPCLPACLPASVRACTHACTHAAAHRHSGFHPGCFRSRADPALLSTATKRDKFCVKSAPNVAQVHGQGLGEQLAASLAREHPAHSHGSKPPTLSREAPGRLLTLYTSCRRPVRSEDLTISSSNHVVAKHHSF